MTDPMSGRAMGHLPVAVTSFVGRRREIADVRKRIAESRLVTLTGVGGVGKTRLAVEVASDLRRAFAGGVALVDLSTVKHGSHVPQAAANALGVLDQSTRAPIDKIISHLEDRHVLIVLDNCEHLLEACAAFVDQILRNTRGVRVLATSRRTLGITGEHLFAVPPLPVPDPQRVPSTQALSQSDAVRLLVDRAVALQPGFTITEDNRLAAARLCAQLDGLPLAIELAATRLRSLSLEQLVDRLEGRFTLLTGGNPAAQPRQQTLRALVDWSYSLCSADEQLLWARLSVFVGTFDLEAVEGVCSGDDLPVGSILDVLDRLVAQSIVVSEPRGAVVRFRLLETIRAYGRDRLTEFGQEAALRSRHRDFYIAVAQQAVRTWCSPQQEAGLARLRADHGNLRAVLDRSMTDPDGPAAALELTVALRHHWYVDGFLSEGRQWLDQALGLPGQVPDARVQALWVAAWVALLQGDSAAAFGRLDECDMLAAELGHESAGAYAISLRGTAELFQGHFEVAIARFDAAIATFRAAGNTEGVLWAMFQLAISLSHHGQTARAAATCRQSLEISEAHGERLCRSYALWVLGFDTWRYGDPAVATEVTREGLAIQRGFHDPVGVALMIELLSWIAASQADAENAARLLGVAGSVWDQIGTTISAFGPPLAAHHADCEDRVQRALGAAGLAAAVGRGRQPSVARAIAAALDEPVTAGAGAGSTGGTGTGAGTNGGGGASVLTRREVEIADLVAQGLSNRAIAASLVISTRTVDGHVERILAKLGFTSRAQVAAWVATRG